MNHHQVVIIGAGPAGLLLARLLSNRGIDCIILENRNESFLSKNNRGGFLEHSIVELLHREKVFNQILEKGIPLSKFHFHVNSEKRSISLLKDSKKKQAYIYDQQNIVADLIKGLKKDTIPIIFEAKAQRYEGLDKEEVKIIYTLDGQIHSLTCDYVIGCDGFRGISRRSIPPSRRDEHKEELPYAWLEWLVNDIPTTKESICGFHKNGFAMQIPTANGQTRFYLQVKRGIEMDDLSPVEEIWEDIESRLGVTTSRGEMKNKKLDYMRSYYTKEMRNGRLFIAGDAAHVVPRFGSKGLNLAFADAIKLATAFIAFYKNKNADLLNNYSQNCLEDNLKIIDYTNQLNQLFHINESVSFEDQLVEIRKFLKDENQRADFIDYMVGT